MSIDMSGSQTSSASSAGAWAAEMRADWTNLIRAEYYEMPGLSLTERQVERLWRLDRPTATPMRWFHERWSFGGGVGHRLNGTTTS